ncbi:hypothetical protein, partial [Nonomuraea antri]|uniref:hypothetical protein n=1 Tax=Nonomuraea antri TaxID=2730852 RepID=UPI001C2C1C6F
GMVFGGEAPWPREIGMAPKRTQPVAWVNPLAGPWGFAVVSGGIAVLMGALWLVARTQRARMRQKVL